MTREKEQTMARSIMIQGTMSNVGKTLMVAGLCRVFHQDGYKVAPFKSQNMALNSFTTPEGLEMATAQAVQAEAAGITPQVLMNPILLKPLYEMGSQVIIKGKVRGRTDASEYFMEKRELMEEVMAAYQELSQDYDIMVIEGAGSPVEINLKQDDLVNMGLAAQTDSPVLLVGDIARGGVFAQLVGTLALFDEDERARVKGMVINKFMGRIELLQPGLTMLEEITHKPVLGTLPYLEVDIQEEDSLTDRHRDASSSDGASLLAGAELAAYKDRQYDILADAIRQNLAMDTIYDLLA